MAPFLLTSLRTSSTVSCEITLHLLDLYSVELFVLRVLWCDFVRVNMC